jgi:hypothetical protein|tara:strand:+ start:752 stop:985 length:234 start_codon:yes stop_codon:yes gene_type:complete
MNTEMKLKAEQMGVTILDFKPTQFEWEGFYIVLAYTNKKEFVTWTWANGGFHHGHYFGGISWANRREAIADFDKRVH